MKAALACLLFLLLAGCSKRVTVDPLRDARKAIQLQCGELTIIVGPDTTPSLELAHHLAKCLGTDKVCTIETVKLNRKSIQGGRE